MVFRASGVLYAVLTCVIWQSAPPAFHDASVGLSVIVFTFPRGPTGMSLVQVVLGMEPLAPGDSTGI